MADAVAYLVIRLLTVNLYEVVKCRIKGVAHWVRAQGPPYGSYKNRIFFEEMLIFKVRHLFSLTITIFFYYLGLLEMGPGLETSVPPP